MMDWFPLPLFPEGALAHSVTTCVWVGVFVIVFFNLRFGWVLSGLVVPGYLAPLLFVKPWAAAVVVGESIVTYGVVYVFSEVMSRLGYWSSLFGRDRFFALVVVSIAVRILFDVLLLPGFAQWLESHHAVTFDFRNNLHSFGLVIICLLANQFWKTGLLRGLFPVVVCIGLTYLIVRFVLMEFTNFSIGNLNYIYEDVAASLLASPKSYMILLVTAFLASRLNLHYGWDFNGILIPSLLALQWYQPEKILVSFIEALVVLTVARGLLKLEWLGRMNIEGGRKLLLFFNISFAYKILLGYALIEFAPDVKATDYYGFGYLLPTLLAVKMHDKEIFARLTRATLQTSLMAVVLASATAFALTRINPLTGLDEIAQVESPDYDIVETNDSIAALVSAQKVAFYGHRSIEGINKPTASELDGFNRALDELEVYLAKGHMDARARAASALARANFELVESPDWLMLRERAPTLGWGVYIIARAPRAALAIELPAPLEDPHLAEVGVALFQTLGGRSLAIAGSSARLDQNRSPIATLDALSIFQAFHRHIGSNDALQVRGLDPTNARSLPADSPTAGSVVLVDGALPEALQLRDLQRVAGAFDVRWSPTELKNVQRESRQAGFAEVYLDAPSVRRLLYASIAAQSSAAPAQPVEVVSGYLGEWLPQQGVLFASRASNLYVAPRIEELLYIDEQVLKPLSDWARTPFDPADDAQAAALNAIDAAADVIGYRLIRFASRERNDAFIVLAPRSDRKPNYWGTYVIRVEPAAGQIIEVPRPFSESGTLEMGISLFEALGARALLVAGAHPLANDDGSADVIRLINKTSLFNLANQVLVRSRSAPQLQIVQIRAFGQRPGLPFARADVLVSSGLHHGTEGDAEYAALVGHLDRLGLTRRDVDGSLETLGYENHFVVQNRYLEQAEATRFTTVWISQRTRLAHREQAYGRQLDAQFASLGIERVQAALTEFVAAAPGRGALPGALYEALNRYRNSRDVVSLDHVQKAFPRHRLTAVQDRATQQLYLAVSGPDDSLVGVVYLGPALEERTVREASGGKQLTDDFVRRRAAWLAFGATP